jgi:glyoxylase-like metal-dependent hydrolase (beta-lactamase superfamily II)
MKISLFNISSFRTDGGAMFGVVPKVLWSRVCEPDANNFIVLTLRSIVIETAGRVILVDTGWGDKQDEKFFRHVYLHDGEGLIGGLSARGYRPGDVTDVILTHLHADHCGGAVKKSSGGSGYELTFPSARYHVSRTQWKWAVRNNIREADSFLEENFLPIGDSGHLNLVEEDCELIPGISLRICYGHTPGLMIPVVDINGRKLVYAGDLIPTVAHIPLIWNMSYDIEQMKTIEEKEKLLREAVEGNHILIFQHDGKHECCTVRMTQKGIRPKDMFEFRSIFSEEAL